MATRGGRGAGRAGQAAPVSAGQRMMSANEE